MRCKEAGLPAHSPCPSQSGCSRTCLILTMGKTRRAQPPRERPNILVTGTPGTGKTTLAAALAAATSLRHVDVGLAIREQSLHSGWDEEFQCHLVDEDKARSSQLSRSTEQLLTPTPPGL